MKLKIFKLKKNTIIIPNMRKGPKGISLFIVMRLSFEFNEKNSISIILMIAPTQKEIRMALAPSESPKNQPIPSANFPSPKPIHFPPEKNQSMKNGRNSIGPEKNGSKVGIDNSNIEKSKNIPASDNTAKV